MEVEAGLVVEGYEFIEPIGKGGYSRVWTVRSHKYDKLFVAKVIRVEDANVDRAWRAFEREIQALMRLNHPNIIKLYGHFRVEQNFVLILEHCPKGSLVDYIKEKGPMDETMMSQVIREMTSALTYAWSRGVQHRDMKPGNILIDENGRTKLADFGISVTEVDVSGKPTQLSDFKGSPACASPEIVARMPYDPAKADIWALGITILWVGNGDIPWTFKTRKEMERLILYGQYKLPPDMSPRLLKIVKRMLAIPPKERELPKEEEMVRLVHAKVKMSRGEIGKVDKTPGCRGFAIPGLEFGRGKSKTMETARMGGMSLPSARRAPMNRGRKVEREDNGSRHSGDGSLD